MSKTQIDSSLIVTTGQTAIVPSGTLLDYAGTTAPSGWLECDGTSYATATYPTLFFAIGYTWGGAGANFNVPDLRRRACVGRGGTGTGTLGNAIGNVGGEETHVQTVSELAAHGHSVTDPGHNHTQNSHTHTVNDPGHNHSQNSHSHGGVSMTSSSCCGGDGTAAVKTVNNSTGSFGSGGT